MAYAPEFTTGLLMSSSNIVISLNGINFVIPMALAGDGDDDEDDEDPVDAGDEEGATTAGVEGESVR